MFLYFDGSKYMNDPGARYFRWQQMGSSYWGVAGSVQVFFMILHSNTRGP